ncbi:hypothetical protein BASA83_007201 [Batrachochytrium salamandrivorans]|nr:hypothetical protein BASA83_007201 [Batrachochytrium salamandrivorans]
MSLFHFNISISTNGLFHNPISTNSSITSSNINRSIPNTPFINTSITSTPTTIPITPTIPRSDTSAPSMHFERTFQVWGKSKLACSYVQANHASSAKIFALAGPQYWPGHRSLSPLTGPLWWSYGTTLGQLKADLLHPTATNPDQLGSPSRCILCHAHLDCKPMAHLVVDCTHPTVFFARVDTQLLQAINDTRVQIFDCTLHTPTTTTTTTTTTTPASPSLSTTSINSSPIYNWHLGHMDSMDIHTPIDNYQHSPRTTPQSAQVLPSSPSSFSIFFIFSIFTRHAFRAANQRCSPGNSLAGPGTVEENPTASRTTTTDTHTAAISSTPTPTHISYIGSDDILTVLLGGSLPGTNTAGNTEAHSWSAMADRGIRLFTGARLSTAIGPLLVENWDWVTSHSLIGITGKLVRSQRWFWVSSDQTAIQEQILADTTDQTKTVKQRHSFVLMETLQTCGDSASLQKYLMLARMDALWTARKAIQIGILVDTHPFSVDHCILCDQQLLSTSIAHLVVECEQVTGHRIQSGLVPAIQKSRLRLLGRALDPGVENVYTWLRGGVLMAKQIWTNVGWTGLWSMNLWGRGMIIGQLAARLADFLQVAYWQYQSTLWQISTRDRLVEVG